MFERLNAKLKRYITNRSNPEANMMISFAQDEAVVTMRDVYGSLLHARFQTAAGRAIWCHYNGNPAQNLVKGIKLPRTASAHRLSTPEPFFPPWSKVDCGICSEMLAPAIHLFGGFVNQLQSTACVVRLRFSSLTFLLSVSDVADSCLKAMKARSRLARFLIF